MNKLYDIYKYSSDPTGSPDDALFLCADHVTQISKTRFAYETDIESETCNYCNWES